MGRKRKDGNPLGLHRRVYWKRGQLQYRHPTDGWIKLGTDITKANDAAARIAGGADFGTLAFWIDSFIRTAKAGKLPAGRKLAPRTILDYEREVEYIRLSPLGTAIPEDAARDPSIFGEYRDNRVDEGRGQVQANHGLALCASTYSWLIETGRVPGLKHNPLAAVTRFTRKAKARYVEDEDFRKVYSIAQRSVCMALDLAYTTLQRPSDLLALPPNPARVKTVNGVSKRVLPITQGKTRRQVDIEITPELEGILAALDVPGERVVKLHTSLVHGLDGSAYTEDGIAAMLRRYCELAKVKPFGLMDTRSKGATDMYLRGVPLEVIQALMGHKSKSTTEIYIKRMLATVSTVRPNIRAGN